MTHSHHITRQPNGQRGSVAILFVLILPILLGCAALAIDLARLNLVKTELQNAVDAAAYAGALSLTDPGAGTDPYNWTAAADSAEVYAKQNFANGARIDDAIIAPGYWNTGSRSFETIPWTPGTGDVPAVRATIAIDSENNSGPLNLFFAPILNIANPNIQAAAVAIIITGGVGGPFDYAIFSGSPTKKLTMNGSNYNIAGSVHTNDDLGMNGSNNTIMGSAEAVGKININGSNITITEADAGGTVTTNGSDINIGTISHNASHVDMPDFSDSIAEAAEAANQVYTSNYTINGSNITSDPIYVTNNKKLTVNGSDFTATGALMADGKITINGSSMASGDSQVCFYSKNGNIDVNGSNYELNGVLYAPNGKININGSNITVNGSVVGNQVKINGSNFSVDRTNNPITSIPGTESSILLVK